MAFLVACGAIEQQGDSAEPRDAMEGEAPDLSGHYRVGPLSDGPLSHSIQVSFDADSVWWEPACSGQGLSYKPAGEGKVEFYDPDAGKGTQIVCDIGFSKELPALWEALEGVRNVELRDDRSVAVTVGDQNLIFEPTTDPLPTTLAGTWQVEMIDGLSTSEMRTIQFSADAREIWWDPRCAGLIMEYRLAGEGFAITKPAEIAPPPPASDPDGTGPPRLPPPLVCSIGLPPHLQEAASALRSADAVTRDYQNNLVFSGSERYIILSRVTG
ncbi:hypothetical protein ACRAQ6_05570 [Erythrobacter sp. HA6-11]